MILGGLCLLILFSPKGSKEQRYDSIIPFIANGSIKFKGERRGDDMFISPENGFKEFMHEYSSFPRGGRDDILDALWIAVHQLTSTVDAVAISDVEIMREDEYVEPMDTPRERVLSASARPSLFHKGLR